MFLPRFDPASIDPRYLVNRKTDIEWISATISEYLRDPDRAKRAPVALCICGEKGCGKTILTKAALLETRRDFSDRAIFVEVDCRDFHSAKTVIDALAANLVTQLREFQLLAPKEVSDELLANAQALAELTRLEDPVRREVELSLEHFETAAKLQGKNEFLRGLEAHFDLSVRRGRTKSKELSGKITMDELRLCLLLIALLKDIHANGIDIVIYIDNMDELFHRYRTDEDRQKAAHETETLLLLRNAPIAFIVNMRTYYQGILPRELTDRRILNPLTPEDLHHILEKRLERFELTRPEIKNAVQTPAAREMIRRLADAAPTPLAFLAWFKVLFEADALSTEHLERGVSTFLANYYGTLPEHVWRTIIRAFDASWPKPINRDVLLAACDKDENVRRTVIDRQGVLPTNFWDPTTFFTLDPELQLVRLAEAFRAKSA